VPCDQIGRSVPVRAAAAKAKAEEQAAAPALAPAPAPTSAEEAEPPELDAWLVQAGLGRYGPQVKEYGYDSFNALRAATEAQIVEMTEDPDIGMKKPHRQLFLTQWQALSVAAVGSQPEPEPELCHSFHSLFRCFNILRRLIDLSDCHSEFFLYKSSSIL
jgi:hypothetical protein